MSASYAPLVEKLSRIVRDRGDIETMMLLDRLMDYQTEEEQTAAFVQIVKTISQKKAGGSSQSAK